MKKKLTALALSGLMLCSLSVSALAAPLDIDSSGTLSAEPAPLADSQLYYGEVKDILTDEEGTLTGLRMDSPRSGEYVMKLSGETWWIDSGGRTASDPATLKVGEKLYVFHSPVSTRSLPPQSAAYAVVRNIPQDAGCAQYHEVEAVEETDEGVQITTDNGGLILFLDRNTALLSYSGDAPERPADIPVGSHIMAWYQVVLQSLPGQAHPSCVMTLEAPATAYTLTVSGKELDLSGLPRAPYEEEGVLMVPLRLIGEALGYTVDWDPESGAITVDDDYIQKATLFDGTAAVSFEGHLQVIDMTHPWENDAPTACYEGCTYVPLTFFETFFNDVSLQGGSISVSPSMAELN